MMPPPASVWLKAGKILGAGGWFLVGRGIILLLL